GDNGNVSGVEVEDAGARIAVQDRIKCKKIQDRFVVARFRNKTQRSETVRGIKTVAELADVAEWMIKHDGESRRPWFRCSRVWVDDPGVRVLIDVVTGLTGIVFI